MKKLVPLAILLSLTLGACTNGPHARQGTAIGAVSGAVVGGLAGRSLGGAAIGAGVGALGGNLIGTQMDRNHYYARH